ncbi:hypothetical protein GCM10009641_74460 [Mycobacterium cookii]|uniref:Acetyl-CoA acetyltransferase n=1 Tax=Nocardioides furvisabuli TaxID=375542 RepID=A0ABN2WWD4_9ACTN
MTVVGLAGWAVAACGSGPERLDVPLGVHLAARAALNHAGLSRADVTGVVLAGSDAWDGRLISSMHMAGPAGGYLRDETKVVDDPSVALASAVWRVSSGADRAVLVVSWHSPAESDPLNAVSPDPEPVFSRPVGAHPLAAEALAVTRWLEAHGLSADRFDSLTAFLAPDKADDDRLWFTPLRAAHVAPVDGAAVAVLVSADGARVEIKAVDFATDSALPLEQHPDPVGRLRQRILARTGSDPAHAEVIETTDRTVFRLVMAASALGLGQPSEVADAVIEGGLPHLQPSGGLFRRNAGYAAGLERIVCAAEAVERGAVSALAHCSYGRAGQGHSLTVLAAPL